MKKLTKQGIKRAAKFATLSVIIMGFELVLLFTLVEFFLMNEVVGSLIALIFALIVNYFVTRKWVFVGTERKVMKGLVIFLAFATGGVALVTALMYIAVEVLQYNYMWSRIIIGLVVGGGNYLNNLYFNFKVNEKNH